MEAIDFVMYSATAFNVVSVLPELYANYVNKNANVYNLPEKIMLVLGCSLGMTYGILSNNTPVFINYLCFVVLESISFGMRVYYSLYNKTETSSKPEINTTA
jgi:uncharacterized protein with PQ loop repeat